MRSLNKVIVFLLVSSSFLSLNANAETLKVTGNINLVLQEHLRDEPVEKTLFIVNDGKLAEIFCYEGNNQSWRRDLKTGQTLNYVIFANVSLKDMTFNHFDEMARYEGHTNEQGCRNIRNRLLRASPSSSLSLSLEKIEN